MRKGQTNISQYDSVVPLIASLAADGHNKSEICRKLGIYDKLVDKLALAHKIQITPRCQAKTKPKIVLFLSLLKKGLSVKQAAVSAAINPTKARQVAIANGYEVGTRTTALRRAEVLQRIEGRFELLSFTKGSRTGKPPQYLVRCLGCTYEHRKGATQLVRSCPRCGLSSGTSRAEQDVDSWVRSLVVKTEKVRMPSGKHLDIVASQQNVAIEYCGLYWHCEDSPEPRPAKYHLSKLEEARSMGLRLITLFEDEWITRNEQVKGYLQSVLGANPTKIGARSCKVLRMVDLKEANAFLQAHHIQGQSRTAVSAWGLFHGSAMVGILTLGRHHRGSANRSVILDRMCFLSGTTVHGGASKMFSAAVQWARDHGYENIISWSDNRYSEGRVYERMGFDLDAELGPDYSYVKDHKRFSKQSKKKTPAEQKMKLTERELRKKEGFDRIWDCGKKRWIFRLTPSSILGTVSAEVTHGSES